MGSGRSEQVMCLYGDWSQTNMTLVSLKRRQMLPYFLELQVEEGFYLAFPSLTLEIPKVWKVNEGESVLAKWLLSDWYVRNGKRTLHTQERGLCLKLCRVCLGVFPALLISLRCSWSFFRKTNKRKDRKKWKEEEGILCDYRDFAKSSFFWDRNSHTPPQHL